MCSDDRLFGHGGSDICGQESALADKKPAGSVVTGPEAEALFRTMTAYAGSYTMKGGQIIHHVDASWNETWTGSDQPLEPCNGAVT